jgi:hypothetical protein
MGLIERVAALLGGKKPAPTVITVTVPARFATSEKYRTD